MSVSGRRRWIKGEEAEGQIGRSEGWADKAILSTVPGWAYIGRRDGIPLGGQSRMCIGRIHLLNGGRDRGGRALNKDSGCKLSENR